VNAHAPTRCRSSSDLLATEILRIVFRHRRLRQTGGGCVADPCPTCLAPHLGRVKRFVLAG
jgi:hypothetical protein